MTNSKKETLFRISLLVTYSLIIFVRVPEIILKGRFWAEEGYIYFSKAYHQNFFEAFFSANLSYYSLYNNIAAAFSANLIPLEYAPQLMGIFAFMVQLLPLIVIFISDIPQLESKTNKILASLLFIFTVPNHDIWLNTVHSQFFFCLCTGLILISKPRNNSSHFTRMIILTISGLTGIVSCFVTPFFLYSWIKSKQFYRMSETLILILCSGLQLFVLMFQFRNNVIRIDVLLYTLLSKMIMYPILGTELTENLSRQFKYATYFSSSLLLLIPILAIGILFIYVIKSGSKSAITFITLGFYIGTLSFLGSIEGKDPKLILAHISATGAERYYFVPNVFLGLAFLMTTCKESVFNWLSKYLSYSVIAIIIGIGIIDYINPNSNYKYNFSGPEWANQVKEWRKDHKRPLEIWPVPYKMKLK